MNPKKLILMVTVLSISVLALAACDATGAVPLNQLVGESGTASSAVKEKSSNAPDLVSTSKMGESRQGSPAQDSADPIKLIGMVEAVTENSITINGMTFNVDSPVDLTTLFEVGTAYEFEYFLNPDGSITVKNFTLADGSSDGMSSGEDMKFMGMLEAVTENSLTFDGMTYTVNTTEDLTTLFTAGQSYEIEYTLNADGTITLVKYSLEDMSSSSSSEGYVSGSSDNSYSDDSYNSYNDNSSDDNSYDSSDDNSNNSGNNYENDSENNSEDNYGND